eukprot:CAMPEP_0202962608 /NCGR_PEP_ID=MMETSP1396-20130829/6716_1 /ASSEMBLY_ACC=CAM_ASM_000872 /TAXON_ID= /ORGANISM="Pseudokeronopsis sp., Strain Brazil" /LENGTH=163 /DNA_ID=CAMNT_0049683317 /DNA_START=232 /DNA_END=725 /DNA_ORIENTATION=+
MIALVELMSGEKLEVKPAKIVAGLEAEKTNLFLQVMFKVATSGADSSPYVAKILGLEDDGDDKLKEKQKREPVKKKSKNNNNNGEEKEGGRGEEGGWRREEEAGSDDEEVVGGRRGETKAGIGNAENEDEGRHEEQEEASVEAVTATETDHQRRRYGSKRNSS